MPPNTPYISPSPPNQMPPSTQLNGPPPDYGFLNEQPKKSFKIPFVGNSLIGRIVFALVVLLLLIIIIIIIKLWTSTASNYGYPLQCWQSTYSPKRCHTYNFLWDLKNKIDNGLIKAPVWFKSMCVHSPPSFKGITSIKEIKKYLFFLRLNFFGNIFSFFFLRIFLYFVLFK
jgi:hypothetical protein